MRYCGLYPTFGEFLIRLHAQSTMLGTLAGHRALADPGPGSPDDKLNRALAALFAGDLDFPVFDGQATSPELDAPPTEPVRRGPGRPRTSPAGPTGRPSS